MRAEPNIPFTRMKRYTLNSALNETSFWPTIFHMAMCWLSSTRLRYVDDQHFTSDASKVCHVLNVFCVIIRWIRNEMMVADHLRSFRSWQLIHFWWTEDCHAVGIRILHRQFLFAWCVGRTGIPESYRSQHRNDFWPYASCQLWYAFLSPSARYFYLFFYYFYFRWRIVCAMDILFSDCISSVTYQRFFCPAWLFSLRIRVPTSFAEI